MLPVCVPPIDDVPVKTEHDDDDPPLIPSAAALRDWAFFRHLDVAAMSAF